MERAKQNERRDLQQRERGILESSGQYLFIQPAGQRQAGAEQAYYKMANVVASDPRKRPVHELCPNTCMSFAPACC